MWFAGTVSEAIGQTRLDQKLLLVFVESAGGDDVSNRSKQSLESLSDQILSHCIPIKLTAGSESANQFSQFYPILVVPATYIINAAGVAVEAIAGEVKTDVFLSKLEAAAATASATVKTTVTSDDTVMNQGSESPNYAPSPDRTAAPPPSPASPPQQPELEEKIALAQRKLEELKAKKEKEEEEAERQQEIERREVGKAVLSAKRKREEMEMIEAANERKRDAALEREHRAKVLAQIELDKEERRKRFGMTSSSSSSSAPESQQQQQQQQTQPKVNCDETRIQFRFPDGHTLTNVFKSSDALSLAWDFVANTEKTRAFILSQMYPRKTFTGDDMGKTFSDLQLVPSAVLLVLSGSSSSDSPSRNRSAVSQGTMWWSYLLPGFLLMPIITIWNFITSFLPSSSSGSPDPQSSSASASTRNSGSQPVREPDPQPSTSGLRRRDLPSRSGNIHRLHNDSDDDDEKKKKTWNGNSTQQM